MLYQELLSPHIVELSEQQYDQMVIDGTECRCRCKTCETKCEFYIQQFVARRARRREIRKLNIDNESNLEIANIGSWSKKKEVDMTERPPYYYNNPYLPPYAIYSSSSTFQIDSHKAVKLMPVSYTHLTLPTKA